MPKRACEVPVCPCAAGSNAEQISPKLATFFPVCFWRQPGNGLKRAHKAQGRPGFGRPLGASMLTVAL